MKKRIVAAIMLAVMLILLCSCGKKGMISGTYECDMVGCIQLAKDGTYIYESSLLSIFSDKNETGTYSVGEDGTYYFVGSRKSLFSSDLGTTTYDKSADVIKLDLGDRQLIFKKTDKVLSATN